MRLVTQRTAHGTQACRVEGTDLVPLAAGDVGEFLARGPDWRARATVASGPVVRGGLGADLAPVVPRPSKIFCLGLNYRSHIAEMGRDVPTHPTLFAKFARALTGPRDVLVLPRGASSIDWEAELGLVIGRPVRDADLNEAAAAIAGYTIVNDVTARDWQTRTTQWLQGKTFEAMTPVGPALVTPDEVDDARDLVIQCEVDGRVMQEARTSDLLFGPAAIVSYISSIITLDPGDLILTGTPAGVGSGRQPPLFLHPGQVLRTTIEGLGELVNACVAPD